MIAPFCIFIAYLLSSALSAQLYEEPELADLIEQEYIDQFDPDDPDNPDFPDELEPHGPEGRLLRGRRLDDESCRNMTKTVSGWEHMYYKFVCTDSTSFDGLIYLCNSCQSNSTSGDFCLSSSHYGCTTGDCSNRMARNSTLYNYIHYNLTHDPANTTSIELLNSPLSEIILSGVDDADCPWRSCYQGGYRVYPQPSYSPSLYITFNEYPDTKTYTMHFNVSKPFDVVSFLYCENGFQNEYFHYRRVTVNCGPSSTVLGLPAGLNYNQSYTLGWGRRPYATVTAFDNTEANCPVSYTLEDESGGFPSWVDSFSTRYGSYQVVYVSQSLMYKDGPYKFRLTGTAKGSSTAVTTGLITLNTVCSQTYSGYNLSAPTFTSPQTKQRDAGNVGFEFPQYNQLIEGCYLETYTILQTDGTTVHPGFANADNVIGTQVGSTVYAYVATPLATATYNFKIKAIARGGASILSGPFQLTVKCIPGSFTVNPETSPLVTSYTSSLEVAGTSKTLTLPNFVTTVTYCEVTEYKIDDDNNAESQNEPAGLSLLSSGCSTTPCRDISYASDVEKTFSFYIVVVVEDGSLHYNGPITINIGCGFETITRNQSEIMRVFSRDPSPNPDPIVESFSTAILTYFTVDNPVCSITSLKLFNDQALTSEITNHPLISIQNTHLEPGQQDLVIKQGTPINETIYLGVITKGNKASSLQVTVVICGYESLVSHRTEVQKYQYWKTESDNNTHIPWSELESYFTFTAGDRSIPECNNETIEFFYDPLYTQRFENDDRVEIVGTGAEKRLHIWVSNAYPLMNLYLLRRTVGYVEAFVQFQMEVCGTESVTLIAPDYVATPRYFFETGDNQKKFYITKSEYQNSFTSSSAFCQPKEWGLFGYDSKSQSYFPYSTAHINMDKDDDYKISIMTKTLYEQWVYVHPLNHGRADYLPYNISVVLPPVDQNVLDAVNKPPKFQYPVRNEYYFFITKEKYKQKKYTLTFSEIEDDKGEFDKLVIDASDLGSLTYSKTENTLEYGSTSQIMSYDPEKGQVILDLKGVNDILPYAKNHSVEITLSDLQNAEQSYNTRIAFQLPIEKVEEEVQEEEVIEDDFEVLAWINEISIYGDVEIEFNKDLNTEQIDMSWFNDSLIQAYIEPANDFHLYQQFDLKQLNFTWSVTSFFSNKLFLKLNFTYPNWISSQDTQDSLIIFIKVVPELFQPQTIMRNLREELYLKLKLPIVRQMDKSNFNQGVEKSLGQQKSAFKASVIISFVLNQLLSGLMDYLLSILNALQIILHLPILQVTLPSNVMMYMSIMIPICLFDILEGQDWYDNLLTQVDEYESPFISSQLAEIGYSTHNPLLNMGSMFAFMFLYTVKVALYFIVLSPLSRTFTSCLRIKNKQKELLFFSEILIIIIEGYLEIELSCILNVSIPFSHEYNTLVNRFFAYFFLLLILLVIPTVIIRVIRCDLDTLEDPEFKAKWGVIYEHVRYDHPVKRQFYLWFIFRRVVIVSITYIFKDIICFQIISIMFLNTFIQIYQGYFSPLKSRFKNQQENFNEFIVYISCLHLITFTDFNADMDVQQLMGWSFIFFISLAMACNMSIVCYMMFKRLLVIYRYWKVRFDHRFYTIPERKRKIKKHQMKRAEIFQFVEKNINYVKMKTKSGRKVTTGGRNDVSELNEHEIKRVSEDVPDNGMRVRWLSNKYDNEQQELPSISKNKTMRLNFNRPDSPQSPEAESAPAPQKEPIRIIEDNAIFDAVPDFKLKKNPIIRISDFNAPIDLEQNNEVQTERHSSGIQSLQSTSRQTMAINFRRGTQPPIESPKDELIPQISSTLSNLQKPPIPTISSKKKKKKKQPQTSSQKVLGVTSFKKLDTSTSMRVKFRQNDEEDNA